MRVPFQTCFSVTCRVLGAALCAHGDVRGLVLPPRLAPVQVVILGSRERKMCQEASASAQSTDNSDEYVWAWCELTEALLRAPSDPGACSFGDGTCSSNPGSTLSRSWLGRTLRVQRDSRWDIGWSRRAEFWTLRGVPLILSVQLGQPSHSSRGVQGPRAHVRITTRDQPSRNTGFKAMSPSEAAEAVRQELVDLHNRLLAAHQARTAAHQERSGVPTGGAEGEGSRRNKNARMANMLEFAMDGSQIRAQGNASLT